MPIRLMVVTLRGLLLQPSAQAATAVPPVNDTKTSPHPVLTWSLLPTETVSFVTISDSPALTPAGEFFDEHLIDAGFPADTATTWAPTSPNVRGLKLVEPENLRRRLQRLPYTAGRIQRRACANDREVERDGLPKLTRDDVLGTVEDQAPRHVPS